jgi:oligopeptide/dipeptide ABC transporter ATP-binding protein
MPDLSMSPTPLLRVENLRVHFPVQRSSLSKPEAWVRAVEDVSFTLGAGETLGLLGESGCGKTTLGRAVLRLGPVTAGTIRYGGTDITRLEGRVLREHRRQFQMIFQDPFSSLNPRFTVGQIVGEPLEIHRLVKDSTTRDRRIGELLESVGLDPRLVDRFPHEFSGGQRQRIGIARALAVEPQLIVCDEPVSALDVSVQAQVVNLLQDLQKQRGLAYLFISHDLAVVEHLAHRILVMYLGQVLEEAPASVLCQRPLHPYTQALVSAIPTVDPVSKRRRIVLSGEPPSPLSPPTGCPFHPRCPMVQPRCRIEAPVLRDLGDGRRVACHQV